MAGVSSVLKKESTLYLILLVHLYNIAGVKPMDQASNCDYPQVNETNKLIHGLVVLENIHEVEVDFTEKFNLNETVYSQVREDIIALTTVLEGVSIDQVDKDTFKEAANQWIAKMDLVKDLKTLGSTLKTLNENVQDSRQVVSVPEKCGWLNHKNISTTLEVDRDPIMEFFKCNC